MQSYPICNGANFKTPPFARYLRQAKILILEISSNIPVVNPAMDGSPFLTSTKIEHLETPSFEIKHPPPEGEGFPVHVYGSELPKEGDFSFDIWYSVVTVPSVLQDYIVPHTER